MLERKTDAINLRMAPVTKKLLRLAAAKERRTLSNMVDFLILDYCERNDLALPAAESTVTPPTNIKLKG